MNQHFVFDINIYNKYLYYSGGIHPDYNQYNEFVKSLYYQNNLYQPYYFFHNPNPQILYNQPKNYCVNGMECKNVNCNDFHHPSKDFREK
jgi:hypothetical protein